MTAPSRPRGDEAVADVGQLDASRAVAATALDELLDVLYLDPDWLKVGKFLEVLGRLVVLAPEQTYAAIQATREGLS